MVAHGVGRGMSVETVSPEVQQIVAGEPARGRSNVALRAFDVGIRSLLPVVCALGAGALLLLALGRDPVAFYGDIWQGGVSGGGWDAWQDSAIRMAPLLLIAAGLTVIFRANIWNLGYNGQFLLAAAVVTGYGPIADERDAALVGDARPLPAGGDRRGCLDDRSRPAEGALRDERDHHDADDVVHRHRPGELPDQGAVPGCGRQHPADARARPRQDAPGDSGDEDPHRAAGRLRRHPRRPLHADADGLGPAAADHGREPAGGAALRRQPAGG